MYLKVRKFLMSFIITLIILALIAGLSTADFNSRSVNGSLSENSILAFAPSNEGLDVKVFDSRFTLTVPDFLIKAKGTVVSSYNNIKQNLNATVLDPKFAAERLLTLKEILEKIVNSNVV